MPPRPAIGHTDSAGETVQRMVPDSKVVNAFNIMGIPTLYIQIFLAVRLQMFICGNDGQAKKTVTDNILTKFGWETIDIGGIEGDKFLEPLAFLWIMRYFRTGNWNHAFKLLRK
ncbi:MAG TPA: hypothetical protein VFI73_06465 [Candidatus Nitrosopolaris sp.]|nr:hypothetical protein [Candidatus Nitrosopolaris sp.]